MDLAKVLSVERVEISRYEELISLKQRGVRLARWTLIGLSNLLPWPLCSGLRARLFKLAGAEIGTGAWIFGQQLIGDPQNLRVGDRAFINARCVFDAAGLIVIGEGALIGPGVSILTTHHAPDLTPDPRPVTIGARSWIGGGAYFLPGCTLEAGSTVGAGSVLLGRYYPAGVYAGNPARFIRAADR